MMQTTPSARRRKARWVLTSQPIGTTVTLPGYDLRIAVPALERLLDHVKDHPEFHYFRRNGFRAVTNLTRELREALDKEM